MVRKIIWRVVIVVLLVTALLIMATQARSLLSMLFVALFFGIAMEPAVNHLHMKRGMKRGAATGLVFVLSAAFLITLTFIMIPGLINVAGEMSTTLKSAIPKINDQFNTDFPTSKTDPAFATAEQNVKDWIQNNASDIMGFAGSTVGLIFQFFTIAMFAFYFAADAPRIRRAVLRKFQPAQQQRLGWAWDTAIEQTGGYLYSRLLLMLINGGLFFFVMLLVGVDWKISLPMSIFEGFVAEFIPAIGTYIGAAVPIVIVGHPRSDRRGDPADMDADLPAVGELLPESQDQRADDGNQRRHRFRIGHGRWRDRWTNAGFHVPSDRRPGDVVLEELLAPLPAGVLLALRR